MSKDKTFSIVANTLGTMQSLNRLNKREFGRIFYGLLIDDLVPSFYINSKYNYYCEEGFIKAYNRLDVRNATRVLDYITEEVHTEQKQLEEGVRND